MVAEFPLPSYLHKQVYKPECRNSAFLILDSAILRGAGNLSADQVCRGREGSAQVIFTCRHGCQAQKQLSGPGCTVDSIFLRPRRRRRATCGRTFYGKALGAQRSLCVSHRSRHVSPSLPTSHLSTAMCETARLCSFLPAAQSRCSFTGRPSS